MAHSLRQGQAHVHLSFLCTARSSVLAGFPHEARLDQTVRHLHQGVADFSWLYLQNLPHLKKKNTERRLEFEWFTGPVSWQRASSYCLQALTVLITRKPEQNYIPLCCREPQRPIFITSKRFFVVPIPRRQNRCPMAACISGEPVILQNESIIKHVGYKTCGGGGGMDIVHQGR